MMAFDVGHMSQLSAAQLPRPGYLGITQNLAKCIDIYTGGFENQLDNPLHPTVNASSTD